MQLTLKLTFVFWLSIEYKKVKGKANFLIAINLKFHQNHPTGFLEDKRENKLKVRSYKADSLNVFINHNSTECGDEMLRKNSSQLWFITS